MQNSNAEAVAGWSELGIDLKNRQICSDDLRKISQLASQYSSANNYGQLDVLLEQVKQTYGGTSHWQDLLADEKFVLALINSKMHREEFREVYQLIEMMKSFSDAESVMTIWNEAHYREEARRIGRCLTPVMKFRIRAKFPPPPNLHPSGMRYSIRLPRSSTAILKRWSADHNAQMPPTELVESLAKEANLTFAQVKNWFKRNVAKYKKEQVAKLPCSQNPIAKVNPCLQLAATNSENKRQFDEREESPTKYLKRDDQRSFSPLKNPNVPPVTLLPASDSKCTIFPSSNLLEFQDEDFLGYIPAYCIRGSSAEPTNNPIVMFDARSIRKKIPNSCPAGTTSVCLKDLVATHEECNK